MSLKLTLPLPPRELTPNRVERLHHMKRTQMVEAYMAEAILEIRRRPRGWAKPRWPSARVKFTIYHADKRHWPDNDNALGWMKRPIDALTRAGIFSDDKLLTHLPVRQVVDADRAGTVDVEIDPTVR